MTERFTYNMAAYPNGPCDYPSFAVACQRRWSRVQDLERLTEPGFENRREKVTRDYFASADRAAFNAASAPAEMPVPPTSRYFQPSLIRFSTSLAFTRIPHGTLCARHAFRQACKAASRSGEFMDTPRDMLRS